MAWKVFLSTFFLIFLAELGDKTQLTALASSAGSKSPWSVFLGASAALVCSTLLAVLLGMILNRQNVVPLSLIKGAAGVLFLVFGVLLLRTAIVGEAEEAPAPAVAPGIVGRVAIEAALEFELAVLDEYQHRSETLSSPRARNLLAALVAEEEDHIRRLEGLYEAHPEDEEERPSEVPLPELPPASAITTDDEELRRVLSGLSEHEDAIAAFYDELARQLPLRGLRAAFHELAGEEREHARQLRAQLPDTEQT